MKATIQSQVFFINSTSNANKVPPKCEPVARIISL